MFCGRALKRPWRGFKKGTKKGRRAWGYAGAAWSHGGGRVNGDGLRAKVVVNHRFGKTGVGGADLLGHGVGEGVEFTVFEGCQGCFGDQGRGFGDFGEAGVVRHVGGDRAGVNTYHGGALFFKRVTQALGNGISGGF